MLTTESPLLMMGVPFAREISRPPITRGEGDGLGKDHAAEETVGACFDGTTPNQTLGTVWTRFGHVRRWVRTPPGPGKGARARGLGKDERERVGQYGDEKRWNRNRCHPWIQGTGLEQIPESKATTQPWHEIWQN